MAKKIQNGHAFPAKFGFTSSSGEVHSVKGGAFTRKNPLKGAPKLPAQPPSILSTGPAEAAPEAAAKPPSAKKDAFSSRRETSPALETGGAYRCAPGMRGKK